MTGMELRLVLRRPENLFATIVIPTLVLVLFSSVGILSTGPGRPVDFLLPGSIALAIIATGLVSLGITTGYDRSYGVLKRLGGSPLGRGELIVARILTVLRDLEIHGAAIPVVAPTPTAVRAHSALIAGPLGVIVHHTDNEPTRCLLHLDVKAIEIAATVLEAEYLDLSRCGWLDAEMAGNVVQRDVLIRPERLFPAEIRIPLLRGGARGQSDRQRRDEVAIHRSSVGCLIICRCGEW